jgi:hypothetical protein
MCPFRRALAGACLWTPKVYDAEPYSKWDMPMPFRDHRSALAYAIEIAEELKSMSKGPSSISLLPPDRRPHEWPIGALLATRAMQIA